jgi:hypothetical protein
MKICAGCPQFKRVCDGEPKSEKKYCFYYHATNHNPKYIQSDKAESIFAEAIKEIKDISPWYEVNDYSIEIHPYPKGNRKVFLLSLKTSEGQKYPMGYLIKNI